MKIPFFAAVLLITPWLLAQNSAPPSTNRAETQPVHTDEASNSSGAPASAAPLTATMIRDLYNRITPSLVAVQLTWESEMGRQELVGAGVVVSEDGLIMTSIGLFDPRLPDDQLKDFKIIIPRHDAEDLELDAIFLGRDERTNLGFVKPKPSKDAPSLKWTPVQFSDARTSVGDELVSIGLLPKSEGYRTYAIVGHVASLLRGEIPHVAVDTGLAGLGSPVFDADGRAVGLVNIQHGHNAFLNIGTVTDRLQSQPHFFVPAYDFLFSLSDLPVAGEPMKLPWMGVVQLAGLNKDVADAFGLSDRPAVEVGDVIPNGPADHAGLKPGDKIVSIDNKPIPRGDTPADLADIVRRIILRKKPGALVRLGVVRAPHQPAVELSIKLSEQPKRGTLAERFYAEDLGFTAREMVFGDTYVRRLASDAHGVVVSFVKPQSAAQTAGLANGDVIQEMNREPVQDIKQFQTMYHQLRKTNPRDPIVLVVLREGQTQTIRIETPQSGS